MADVSATNDFLSQYRGISNKLKKRFLRKPNVAEASEQFGKLAVRCEHEEVPHYSGLCWIAAARCEGSLGNTSGEAWALLRGGRQFLSAEVSSTSLGCPSAGEEHLQAALSCYTHAGNRWEQQHSSDHPTSPPCPLAAGVSLELGHALHVDLNRPAEAATQYQRAAGLQKCSPLDRLHSLGKLASCKIQLGDYDGALSIFNEMASLADFGGNAPVGVYRDILHRCEVTRILLLLILQPSPQKLSPDLAQVLEKYAWAEDGTVPVNYLNEDEFLLLQSLVMACQSRDIDSLHLLEDDLWTRLDIEQKDLLRTLVKRMNKGIK